MEWYLTLLAVYRNKKEVLFNIINREGLKTNSCSSNQTSRGSVRSLRLTETKSSTQVAEKKKKHEMLLLIQGSFPWEKQTKTKRDKNHENKNVSGDLKMRSQADVSETFVSV